MEIKPDRYNWQQFCQEEELTDMEFADCRRMAVELMRDGAVFDFVYEATKEELQASQVAEKMQGWDGLVASADAHRELIRAELKAWRKYYNDIRDLACRMTTKVVLKGE